MIPCLPLLVCFCISMYDSITNHRDLVSLLDQFIACGRSRDKAHELASEIWLAVINNLEENQHTFLLLKRLAQEGDVSIFVSSILFSCHKFWFPNEIHVERNDSSFSFVQFFLPFPYTRSYKVLCRVFEKLFTDFRDCLSREDYYDVLACAKSRFRPIPSTWLGY
ncbi:hypothetical protein BHE74_00013320 [Ensete ventricosum]|nr:hypothetical protein BHE74_00013320 [Ensete ventricosum]RZR84856.1 hypothetical protein BHM03_00011740 [Ensete ventricosum]